MHAGKMKNDSRQRAHGNIFSAATGETILPAEIQNDKCTPARRRTTPASGHTKANSTPPAARRSCRQRNRTINARRRGKERHGPAGTRRHIPRRQFRNLSLIHISMCIRNRVLSGLPAREHGRDSLRKMPYMRRAGWNFCARRMGRALTSSSPLPGKRKRI